MKYLILMLLFSTAAYAVEPPAAFMKLEACSYVLQEDPNPYYPSGNCTLEQLINEGMGGTHKWIEAPEGAGWVLVLDNKGERWGFSIVQQGNVARVTHIVKRLPGRSVETSVGSVMNTLVWGYMGSHPHK